MKDILEEEIIDLDAIIDNNRISIKVEIIKDENVLLLTTDDEFINAYNYEDVEDIINIFKDYINNYVEERL